jgi:hypothetical protein
LGRPNKTSAGGYLHGGVTYDLVLFLSAKGSFKRASVRHVQVRLVASKNDHAVRGDGYGELIVRAKFGAPPS